MSPSQIVASALIAGAACLFTSSADAHAVLEPGHATVGAPYRAAMKVTHGSEGSDARASKSPAPALILVASKDEGPTYKLGTLTISAPWARATPGGAKVGGGYVKITNTGSEPDYLIGGTMAGASTVEVHDMAMADGVMKMRALPDGLEIAPGKTVELKPGGIHLMFVGLSQGLTAGKLVKATLAFKKAGTIEVEFRVAPIGAKSSGGEHSHH